MSVERVKTLIVGGGQAGLAMSHMLTQRGCSHLMLERSRIAERRRTQRIHAAHEGVVNLAPDLSKRLAHGDGSYAVFLDMVDAHIERHGLAMPKDTAARTAVPDPPCLIEPLRHLDLQAAGIGTVIWATGYDYDFGWIVVPVLNTRGKPVHSQGITGIPGMYFLGLRWLANFKSSLLSGIGEDAARLADHIAARTC